ncbi:MAG: glycosyltransferase family 2 protein [Bacteroidetes bacterium]|nr:MAG: glycosyltransferase family 2 protein [Bacteroidota bacterium]
MKQDIMTFWDYFLPALEWVLMSYGILAFVCYAAITILSYYSIKNYKSVKRITNFHNLVSSSELLLGVSIIAPAFNEEKSIVTHVRSLLAQNYPKFEVIVVNDGSTDGTLQKLMDAFGMENVEFAYHERIPTADVKGIYKSKQHNFSQLIVVDKDSGYSKADATNAGINAANFPYILCTDVDCILQHNAIAKLVQPILAEKNGKRVLAVGATLRLVNGCETDEYGIVKRKSSNNILLRFQEIEYLKTYILHKTGLSLINSVPSISGALGLMDKEIAIEVGGYDKNNFREDMEILLRMIKYAHDYNIGYQVKYIPETLCWTEAPNNMTVFVRQRTRWSLGFAQMMFLHLPQMFRAKYGRFGWVVLPYNFFLEFIAPVFHVLIVLFYAIMVYLDFVRWNELMFLVGLVYVYNVLVTTLTILWDQVTSRSYETSKNLLILCLLPFIEPFLYYPITIFTSLRGYWLSLTNREKVWGNMQRKGFNTRYTPLKKMMPATAAQ